MSRASRALFALLLTAAVSCGDDTTSLFLRVENADGATQLEVRGLRDGEPWFGPERRPEQEGTPFSGEQTLRLRFDTPPDGSFELQVDALFKGLPFARARVQATPKKGEEMEVQLKLERIPPGPPPDGGTPDGGTPDGGEPDAGGPDGGTPDGGSSDGGEPDAGDADAGLPDAGLPDAGGVCTTCVQPGGACVPTTSARACGGSGLECVDCIADGRANQCTASGACSCGDRGTPCGQGERCEAGTCVCDPDTCAGCCQGNVCRNGNTMAACGLNGATCAACNTSKADNCASGGCRCGSGDACTGIFSCRSGQCTL